MENFRLRILEKPREFIRVANFDELMNFVGPNWPLFIHEVIDDPARPGDTSQLWTFIRHDGVWFGYCHSGGPSK